MPDQQLGFHLLHGIKRYADSDQQTCSSKLQGRTPDHTAQYVRYDSYESQEESSKQGDSVQDPVEGIRCRPARSDAWDEAAVLLQVFSNVLRVEGDDGIEEGECDDEQDIEYGIDRRVDAEPVVESCCKVAVAEKYRDDRAWQHEDRRGEDDRDDACLVELHRDEAGLATVHLPADYFLCVVDRHFSLGLGYVDDSDNGQKQGDRQQDRHIEVQVLVENGTCADYGLDYCADAGRYLRNDADEDDQGDTVADASFVDLFSKPHQEHGTCGDGGNADQVDERRRIRKAVVGIDEYRDADRLDQRQYDRHVTGPLGDLFVIVF